MAGGLQRRNFENGVNAQRSENHKYYMLLLCWPWKIQFWFCWWTGTIWILPQQILTMISNSDNFCSTYVPSPGSISSKRKISQTVIQERWKKINRTIKHFFNSLIYYRNCWFFFHFFFQIITKQIFSGQNIFQTILYSYLLGILL